MNINEEIKQKLFENKDEGYRDFQSRLMPNIDKEKIIGVRNPVVRNLAKEYSKKDNISEFVNNPVHEFYEENNLHILIIEKEKDFDKCVSLLDEFLPYVDNWATCDMASPKVFAKNTERLYPKILEWINSGKTYTVRFGIQMLMNFYLTDKFDVSHCEKVCEIKSDEYYVNMMRAWYFATALAKQYEAVLPFIEKKKLDKWTHNKTISKAHDSFRITKEQKEYLKTLRIK